MEPGSGNGLTLTKEMSQRNGKKKMTGWQFSRILHGKGWPLGAAAKEKKGKLTVSAGTTRRRRSGPGSSRRVGAGRVSLDDAAARRAAASRPAARPWRVRLDLETVCDG